MAQMVLLAGPGVVISTFFLGAALKLTFPYDWNWKTSLLLGALLSATDPVAVVAHLKELGASKKLNTIIEGESLMNDGAAIVVYQLFYRMVLGRSFGGGSIIKFLAEGSLGAVALGLAFGVVSLLWLGFIFNDTIIEITLTLAASYIAFFTAQDALEVSCILTVMTLGMFYAAFAKTSFKGDSLQSLHHFWEIVAYIANTLIFILSGVVIADGVLQNNVHFERHGTSWGLLLLLYLFVQLARAVVVGGFYPLLRYSGYGLDLKEATIVVCSGLRGAVSLSQSLSVKRASDAVQPFLRPEVGTMFVFFTGGIVFLTLILNGSATQFLLHLLGMDKLSITKLRILNYTRYEMLNKALEAFGNLRDDEELGPADWVTVKKYITCLNNLEDECVHPHIVSDKDDHVRTMNLRDIRVRHLNGDSEVTRTVIDESNAEGEEAGIFLEDVRVTFPQIIRSATVRSAKERLIISITQAQVLCVLKTRQVTYSVLTHLSEYIQNLQKTGLLEEKEMVHLDDAFQTDLKKLKRNPPLVKMPTVRDLLNTHPLVGALPAAMRDPLLSNTKETVKGRGTVLYREGSRPTGIYMACFIGAVKWASQTLSSRHSLDPIFSHGSTLGLHEVLTGKSYICDMITDSVVHCFFIEAEKIERLCQSDPSIEAFLWQESVLVIARLLLPRIFEKMAMHEMRLLIAERSTMNIYIEGEDIKLEHNHTGILLEGLVRNNEPKYDHASRSAAAIKHRF